LLFSALKKIHVTASKSTSAQASSRPRKSLTLLQILGIVGGAALIAAIILNLLV
jgi:hypothetical protein